MLTLGYSGGGTRVQKFPPESLFSNLTFEEGTHVGLSRRLGGFSVYSDLGGYWIKISRYDTGGGTRSSCRGNVLDRAANIYPCNRATGRSGFSTGTLYSYSVGRTTANVNNRADYSDTTGHYLEWSVTGEGDLYVIYTGRTDCGIAKVTINGASTLVNELEDQGGYKGFSTITATDLARRSYIKVASGLPADTYTVRVEVSGDTAATFDRLYIEAVAITQKPHLTATMRPPAWQTGLTVKAGDEFIGSNGYYYAVRADGTTGATEPTHTSGTGSDGTLDYNVWTESSWTFAGRTLDYSSEMEYAATGEITASVEFGGQTHGNETSNAAAITLDGVAKTEAGLSYSSVEWGSQIALTDNLTWVHTDDATAGTMGLYRNITPGKVRIQAALTATTASMDLGWFYTAMKPAIRWDGTWVRAGYAEVKMSNGAGYTLEDYTGGSTDITATDITAIGYRGDFDGAAIVSGIYNAEPSEGYIRLNLTSAASGSTTTWQTKAYLRRATTVAPETITDGETITWEAEHFDAVALA